MNYCGQPFADANNPLAVCGMIDIGRIYQCPRCAALSHRQCIHGQLKRVCRECELEAEIEALRAQVAEKRGWIDALDRNLASTQAKLADALSLLAHKGHDADCPAGRCSFVGFTGRCGESPEWHKQHKVGHEYQSPPCSDACGLERCGVKA